MYQEAHARDTGAHIDGLKIVHGLPHPKIVGASSEASASFYSKPADALSERRTVLQHRLTPIDTNASIRITTQLASENLNRLAAIRREMVVESQNQINPLEPSLKSRMQNIVTGQTAPQAQGEKRGIKHYLGSIGLNVGARAVEEVSAIAGGGIATATEPLSHFNNVNLAGLSGPTLGVIGINAIWVGGIIANISPNWKLLEKTGHSTRAFSKYLYEKVPSNLRGLRKAATGFGFVADWIPWEVPYVITALGIGLTTGRGADAFFGATTGDLLAITTQWLITKKVLRAAGKENEVVTQAKEIQPKVPAIDKIFHRTHGPRKLHRQHV